MVCGTRRGVVIASSRRFVVGRGEPVPASHARCRCQILAETCGEAIAAWPGQPPRRPGQVRGVGAGLPAAHRARWAGPACQAAADAEDAVHNGLLMGRGSRGPAAVMAQAAVVVSRCAARARSAITASTAASSAAPAAIRVICQPGMRADDSGVDRDWNGRLVHRLVDVPERQRRGGRQRGGAPLRRMRTEPAHPLPAAADGHGRRGGDPAGHQPGPGRSPPRWKPPETNSPPPPGSARTARPTSPW